MTLLEIQVTDMREDLTTTDETVADLDEDVNFLFDEQIIQDERLLNQEETSVQFVVELAEVNADLQGRKSVRHICADLNEILNRNV